MKAFVIICYDSEGRETEVMAVTATKQRAEQEIKTLLEDDKESEIDYNEYSIEEYEILN